MKLLAGDIGGTKTNLAVFSSEEGPRHPLAEATFPSAQYAGVEVMAREFLAQHHQTVEYACFGVAGPVVNGQVTGTNIPWTLNEQALQRDLQLKAVRLLNDLESIAYGLPLLDANDLYTLNVGQPTPHGNLAVIAPGTGLGEAFVTWDGTRYHAHASEGGHTDFAPGNLQEVELLRYLLRRYAHVSYERVCSGRGIPNLYAFLKESGYEEPAWLAEQLAKVDDPTPVIVNTALDPAGPSALCSATLDLFISILGAKAGNLALTVLATGGVYLGGGIPPRILAALKQGLFLKAFRHKGRLADLMTPIPIHVILNPQVALLGAAGYGLSQWG